MTCETGETIKRKVINTASPRPWTDALDETLRQLWAEGLTIRAIGKIIDRSRNSVVGRAHRLGLPGRGSPINPPRTAPLPPPRVRGPTLDVVPQTVARVLARVYSAPRSCQWLDGDEKPWVQCTAPTVPGHSYCLPHCRRAYSGFVLRVAA